jgi:hypothetical protein
MNMKTNFPVLMLVHLFARTSYIHLFIGQVRA